MRLLIVNPNTSAGVTARIDAAAQAVAGPGDRFVTVSALSVPPLIVTEADTQAAIAGVLGAVAQHQDTVDGIVLASFGDTGAAEVRAAYPHLPVLGIAEAAFAEGAARVRAGQNESAAADALEGLGELHDERTVRADGGRRGVDDVEKLLSAHAGPLRMFAWTAEMSAAAATDSPLATFTTQKSFTSFRNWLSFETFKKSPGL